MVRKLESVVERGSILCPGPVLQLADKLEISSLLIVIYDENLGRDGAKPNS